MASSRLTWAMMFVESVSAGVCQEAPTKLWAARWITWEGFDGLDEPAHRGQIPQIGLDERDPGPQVIDVLGLAPPPAGPEDHGALPSAYSAM